jgi:hypothetical protein
LFPQLIASIVRYRDIAEQLTARRVTTTDLTEGTAIFIIHLAKRSCSPPCARIRPADAPPTAPPQ